MLDNVRHVYGIAIDSSLLQGGVKELSGRTDERFARQVFIVTGLLAYEHEPGFLRAFTEDRLGAAFPQVASFAAGGCFPQLS